MNRREFISSLVVTAGGLYLPYEPKVIYSFPAPTKFIVEHDPTGIVRRYVRFIGRYPIWVYEPVSLTGNDYIGRLI